MARLFPMVSGAMQVKSFTSNQTFTMPAGVTSISVTGKGADGTASSWATGTISLSLVIRQSTSNGGTVVDRSEVTAHGLGQEGAFAGTGERLVSYVFRSFRVGPDGLTETVDSVLSQRVRGGYTTSIGTSSGALTYANYNTAFFRVSIEKESGGTNGTAATGFNKTFPGGVGGPATPVTYDNVPVTPGTPYSVVVPPGGSITITYIS